ncbi:hypothetical protein EJB05_14122 [Eragrostis curvula]|uniref:Uncharacterized protein n=1 Tax=Eragrostis curvula TaxID=38414 RepID=A0A5J9VY80_9POAL|nr:hypothetical protein EJB05_14122 [Eragrostis curvula]
MWARRQKPDPRVLSTTTVPLRSIPLELIPPMAKKRCERGEEGGVQRWRSCPPPAVSRSLSEAVASPTPKLLAD